MNILIFIFFFIMAGNLFGDKLTNEKRSLLYQETKQAAVDGFNVNQQHVILDQQLTKKMIEGTERIGWHNSKKIVLPNPGYDTQYIFAAQDTLDMAESFQLEGLNPVALNLANPKQPGGGVERGSGAQEESIFRRTNYHLALIPKRTSFYPIHGPEVIYTPCVQVFRTKEEDEYQFRKPFAVAIIACAAIDLSDSKKEPGDYEARTKNKISMVLRTAVEKGHDAVVLGALGCGVFKNDPQKIGGYFKEILNSGEFKGRFKKVGFAILYNDKLLENFKGQIIGK